MKQYLKEFFTYSRTEQKGIIFLVVLLLSSEIIRMNWHRIFPPAPPAELLFSDVSQNWIANKQKESDSIFQRKTQGPKQLSIPSLLKPFDPNLLNEDGWQAMGFTAKESASILKFISKGGRFRNKEDLKRLYCMNESRYAALSPYVKIDSTIKSYQSNPKGDFKRPLMIELNSADSTQLMQLKGIGKFRASQIVRRRNQLGGFWNTKQLLEIKNFPDSLYHQIRPFITLDTSNIKKINVNQVKYEDLQMHPYFWYGVAKSIVNYRIKHGPFRKPSDLQAIYAIKPEQLEKVVHYLTFE
jgi:DNA uptake protein ComE-like DNA-binding protein